MRVPPVAQCVSRQGHDDRGTPHGFSFRRRPLDGGRDALPPRVARTLEGRCHVPCASATRRLRRAGQLTWNKSRNPLISAEFDSKRGPWGRGRPALARADRRAAQGGRNRHPRTAPCGAWEGKMPSPQVLAPRSPSRCVAGVSSFRVSDSASPGGWELRSALPTAPSSRHVGMDSTSSPNLGEPTCWKAGRAFPTRERLA